MKRTRRSHYFLSPLSVMCLSHVAGQFVSLQEAFRGHYETAVNLCFLRDLTILLKVAPCMNAKSNCCLWLSPDKNEDGIDYR